MLDYVLGPTLILVILLGWIAVQEVSRRFAARHPEYGERQECMGCGLLGSCQSHPGHSSNGPGHSTNGHKTNG
ncbi:MAG: chemotaxis protein [Spirochaetia bacterium]